MKYALGGDLSSFPDLVGWSSFPDYTRSAGSRVKLNYVKLQKTHFTPGFGSEISQEFQYKQGNATGTGNLQQLQETAF